MYKKLICKAPWFPPNISTPMRQAQPFWLRIHVIRPVLDFCCEHSCQYPGLIKLSHSKMSMNSDRVQWLALISARESVDSRSMVEKDLRSACRAGSRSVMQGKLQFRTFLRRGHYVRDPPPPPSLPLGLGSSFNTLTCFSLVSQAARWIEASPREFLA